MIAAAWLVTAIGCLGSAAPSTLRVGATQPFPTIGQALLAAQPGDLILVDPGTYPPFVVTQSVTIAASGGGFVVTQLPGAAAIQISAVSAPVMIDGASIAFSQAGAPAIAVAACSAPVHLRNVAVVTGAPLVGAAARAAIEVSTCASVVLEAVSVGGAGTAAIGSTSQPDGTNDGLSALRAVDTPVLVRNCTLRGFASPANGAFGGDAIRLVSVAAPGACWLFADTLQTLVGGASSGRGGNCLHAVGLPAVTELCGMHGLAPGAGAPPGGRFAINNDGGVIGPGQFRMIPACVVELVAMTVAPASVATGSSLVLDLVDAAGGAIGILCLGAGSGYQGALPGIVGRGFVDLPSTQVVGVGVTPFSRSLAVPPVPALAGALLTAQSLVLGMNGWPVTVASWPAHVSVR